MEKTENNATIKKFIAEVKSPSKEVHIRDGNGFSLAEIKAAGKTIAILKELNIKIDYFRRSTHEWNIEQIKALKPPKRKLKKKRPYLPKEERIKARRKAKMKVKPKEEMEILPEIEELKIAPEAIEPEAIIKKKGIKIRTTPVAKAKAAPVAKPTAKPTLTKTIIAEEKETPLTKLSGLGATTSKKFKELGVNSIQELLKEDAEELSMLISGVSPERIKKWIQEGKELLNK